MKKPLSLLLLVFFFTTILTSCALKPIPSEYTFVESSENIEINKLGKGKILIYNGANIFHKIDNTARLNLWINEKALGQIRPSEYVIINLENGKYNIKALHIDMVNMRSEHSIEVNDSTKVIMVKPTITSNKLEITNQLPNNFEKFKYVTKR